MIYERLVPTGIEGIIVIAPVNSGHIEASRHDVWGEDFVEVELTQQILGSIYGKVSDFERWDVRMDVPREGYFDGRKVFGVFL